MLSRERTDLKGAEIVGLLDIGTSKTACLIAAIEPAPRAGVDAGVRVLGVGHTRARGLKGGVITDLSEAETAVRAAIAQAERMAQVTLEEVLVSVSCGRLQSAYFAATVDVAGGVVAAHDIERVMAGGRSWAERDGRMLLHLNRVGFRLDGLPGSSDPRGMAGRHLSADLHTIVADEPPIRNLLLVVERCYLSVRALVAAPYASAIAATSEEERRLGVTCIDIGAGTATVAAFAEGHFIHAAAVPVGGHNITFDIAHALQTPLAEAERIKTLYGTMIVARSDEHEAFSFGLAGEEEGAHGRTTKAHLAQIIRPRIAQILDLVRERMEQAGVPSFSSERVVLTGGTAGLVGIGEFAANALGRPVRVGKPQVGGLPQGVSGSAFSTVAGLLAVAGAGGEEAITSRGAQSLEAGYLERVGQWLKAGFG
jgi:cell division protein FtsA